MSNITSISLGKILKKIFCEDEELTQLVEPKNICSMVLQPTNFPFISFRRNSTEFKYNKDCPTLDIINVDIIAVSNNYAQSVEIAECVRNILEYHVYKDTNEGILIDYMVLTDASEDTISESFVQTLTFEIHIQNI